MGRYSSDIVSSMKDRTSLSREGIPPPHIVKSGRGVASEQEIDKIEKIPARG